MENFVIEYKGNVYRVWSTYSNINIQNSYRVKTIHDMKKVLYAIRDKNLSRIVYIRSNFSMINEWRVHNLLYDLHYKRERTADVDLDYPQKWYIKLAYTLLSPLYLHFI